MTGIQVQSHLF